MESRAAYCSVPGKLMIAGEYSVLLPGGASLAMAIEDRLIVSVRQAAVDTVYSTALGLNGVAPGRIEALRFVEQALTALRTTCPLPPLEVHIEGTMGQQSGGQKLGLGSSSAVCVGLVGAGLAWAFGRSPAVEDWFALAHRAHASAQGKLGSGYDVITQIQGGVVVYRRNSARSTPKSPETESSWETLRVGMPESLFWGVLFSGLGANTRQLVQRAFSSADSSNSLEKMRRLTLQLIDTWQYGAVSEVLRQVDEAQAAFEIWADWMGGAVFPPVVRNICEVVRQQGGIPRVSGAGGGDCVLVFADDRYILERSLSQAAEIGSKPASLALAHVGAQVWCVE